MDWAELIVFVFAVGLAIYTVNGAFKREKGTLRQYIIGMVVGAVFGAGAVLDLGWSWTIGMALGIGCASLAPGVAKAWEMIVTRWRTP